MAELSNKERVHRGLDLLGTALGPYIDQAVLGKLAPGASWTDVLEARYPGNTYVAYDVSAQLRIISDPWPGRKNPFWDLLGKVVTRSYASELIEARNKASHGGAFTAEEAVRVLDTIELLLKEIGAPRVADDARKLKRDLQASDFKERERKSRRELQKLPSLEAAGLPAWRTVLEPHPDVAAGDFVSAEFAADLYQVANGESGEDYSDPVEFFQRTYLTGGLQTLLKHVARRLNGDTNAEPIINLQTTFGGGKTHSMLAAWHLFAGKPLSEYPQGVQDTLAGVVDALPSGVRRVAIVGNELSPGQTWTKPDGTVVHTLWGELAWQLGGAGGYALVADADKSGTNPGAALRTLLDQHSPALILIDEWVAYARGLVDRQGLPGGEFGVQRDFAQTLNGAVKGSRGVALLVSIPASEVRGVSDDSDAFDIEIGGRNGRLALEMLDHTITRDAFRWTPASSVESFEIVKRRLFREPDSVADATINKLANRFMAFYGQHRGELPSSTEDDSYKERIKAAYPIHPELFDRLYGDWSTLERFQRTRGVLRLMSAVVHALYAAEDDSPLIMPGSIPLDVPAVRDELTGYLDDAWKAIIEKDIDGALAAAVGIDKERTIFGGRALTRRIARAAFLGSAATLGSAHKGIERKQVFLGVAMPGDTIGNFGSALSLLGERATHLYEDHDRYWFDRLPSLNRVVAERAESYSKADVDAEIVKRLRQEPRSTPEVADVVLAPDQGRDVPEAERVRLVVAGPAHPHASAKVNGGTSPAQEFALEATTKAGGGQRFNANTVVVLAPDKDRLAELETAVRQHMAWRDVVAAKETYDLSVSQVADAQHRVDLTNATIRQRLLETWIWALHAIQKPGLGEQLSIQVDKVAGATDSVVRHVTDWMRKNDVVVVQTSPQAISIELANKLRAKWNQGRISVKDLWECSIRYPYMPRLKDKTVLLEGIRTAMIDTLAGATSFALADGYDDGTGDFIGLRIPGLDPAPTIADSVLLVAPTLASSQRAREREEAEKQKDTGGNADSTGTPGEGGSTGDGGRGGVGGGHAVVRNVSYHGVVDLKPQGDLAHQVKQIADEVLVRLQGADADSLEIRIVIDASKSAGFDSTLVRIIKENGNTLGFSTGHFTDQ